MLLLARWKENRVLKVAVIAILTALAAISVIKGCENAVQFSQDFQWDAAKAFAMRLDPYELSRDPGMAENIEPLGEFYRMFTDRGLTQKMEANQFPSLLMLLLPMTIFSPYTAKIVWMALNLLFTAGIVWLLRRTFFEDTDIFDYAALSLLMIAGTPYRNQLGVGQHTLFSFFFFMLAVYIDKKAADKPDIGKGVLMSICLAVSYFKYTLTAPLALYFIFRKRYRQFALSLVIHIVLTGIAALWLGKSFIYMITAPLKVASVLVSEGGLDLGVFIKGGYSFAAAAVIAALLVYLAVRIPKDRGALLFSILVLWSLVLTYHRTYDFFVYTAAAAVFTAQGVPEGTSSNIGTVQRSTRAMFIWYLVLMVMLYFVLRIFDENTVSKLAVGITYYLFAAALTVIGFKSINKTGDV